MFGYSTQTTMSLPFDPIQVLVPAFITNTYFAIIYRKKFFILNDDVQEALEDNTLLFVLLYHQVSC